MRNQKKLSKNPKINSILLSSLLLMLISFSQNAFARECVKPKSYYKNVICTSDISYFIANKDSGEPAALLNKSGKKIVDLFNYQKVLPSQLRSGLLPVQKNGRVGYINTSGKEIIPTMYEPMNGNIWARSANNGRIVVKKNGGLGIISTSNSIILPFSRSITRLDNFSGNRARMTHAGAQLWVNKDGKMMPLNNNQSPPQNHVQPKITTVTHQALLKPVQSIGASEINLTPEQITQRLQQNKPTPLETTEIVLSPEQINQKLLAGGFDEESKIHRPALHSKNININQNIDVSLASQIEAPTVNPSINTTNNTKNIEFFPHKMSGKWGFVDKNDVNMIVYSFDQVEGFSEGLAGIRVGKKWGFLDKTGDLVISFNFDEAGVDRENTNYKGKPPFVFTGGKAWVGNLINDSKLCINTHGLNVEC